MIGRYEDLYHWFKYYFDRAEDAVDEYERSDWRDRTASSEVIEVDSLVKLLGPLLAGAAESGDTESLQQACGFIALRVARIAYLVSIWSKPRNTGGET